ncbi:MAG: AbgT family transporter [Chloroflexaceae bacterium]|nr:AbgT family transporter [Chloroflexaceae bacterium]
MTAETSVAGGGGGGGGSRSLTDRLLDGIEIVGNKVPHPVLMFLYLIAGVIVLSAILALVGVSATEEIAVPVDAAREVLFYADSAEPSGVITIRPFDTQYEIREETVAIQSLLSVDGIRFIFTSFVANFAGFGVVAVTLVAMAGVGVAEKAGMMAALIRKLVEVAPRQLLSFFMIFVGVLSSVASDAGYLILIPLAAAAFMTVGRHPLAGMAAAFAGVGAIFGVNLLLTPTDAMLTEITNEAILVAGGQPIIITANYYFSAVSSIVLAIVAVFITERIVEPRLGKFDPSQASAAPEAPDVDEAGEAKGLRYALYATLGIIAFVLLITLPPGAPLRDPETGAIIGNTPFMDSLIFIISLIFLIAGIGYGIGANTIKHSNDVINAVTQTFASLSGLIFMLLMISQFIAIFNFSNIPTVAAITLAGFLEQANIGAIPLLIGFIFAIVVLDFILPGLIPKWAIFAPVFVPIFLRLDVPPQTLLAAYRVGDSPVNTITPLMVYLPFIVTIAQRYQKDAGLGTVIALMLPYVLIILIAWIILFVAWFALGIPLGPGYPVRL